MQILLFVFVALVVFPMFGRGNPEGVAVNIDESGCPGCVGDEKSSRSLRTIEIPPDHVQTYPFFPQAGLLWGDLFLSNYTDRIAGSTFGDFDLGEATYDGHRGIDTNLLFWEQQDAGFPIFAVLDGTVIDTRDGEPDRNTEWAGQPSNFVVLDHGDGHLTRYFHLKTNSVAVEVGDEVSAGQQIGLTGSSGISTAPHLHFETRIGSSAIEPFVGPGRVGESLWQVQPENRQDTYVREFIVSPESLSGWEGLPESFPKTGTLVASPDSQPVFCWWYLINRPADSSYLLRILRPDGSLATSTSGSSESPSRRSWIWRSRNLVFNTVGTWQIELEIDGKLHFSGPLEVIDAAETPVNRPPFAADFRFQKNPLTEEDVPVCEASSFELMDDPDYDFVSYRYIWSVNDVVVRDLTSGAKSDALARNLIQFGDVVVCEVTPTDLIAHGPSTRVKTVVSESFAAWCERLGVPFDPDHDGDRDGLNQGQEYALGYLPTVFEKIPPPTRDPQIHWQLDKLSPMPLAARQVRFSEDLHHWVDAIAAETPFRWLPPQPSETGFFIIETAPEDEPAFSRNSGDLGPPTP